MGVGDGSVVGDALGSGDLVAGMNATLVADGASVAGCVAVTIATTKRVTVGGIGVVNTLTAIDANAPRLAKANARHSSTSQKPTNSITTRLT